MNRVKDNSRSTKFKRDDFRLGLRDIGAIFYRFSFQAYRKLVMAWVRRDFHSCAPVFHLKLGYRQIFQLIAHKETMMTFLYDVVSLFNKKKVLRACQQNRV